MTRLLFLAAPIKISLYRNLRHYIPSEVDCKIVSAATCYGIDLPVAKKESTWFIPSNKAFEEFIRFKPDLVLTDYAAYPSWFCKAYSILAKRRVPLIIWLLGDFWREYFTLISTLNLRQRALNLINFFFWSTGLRYADCIMPVCRWLEEIVKERLPKASTKVVYQGVDSSMWMEGVKDTFNFKKPAVGILQDNNIWFKSRGLIWFRNVVRKMEDVNFYIAGGGPYSQQVKRAYSGLKNAHFVGRVPYPDGVKKFHASCDLHVLASGLDCCPTSLLEASLCKKAIVASKVGGVPELIVEGRTGWTVPNGSIREWVEKISSFIEDTSLATEFGENGRRFVSENFDWKIQINKLLEVMTIVKRT